MAHWLGVECFNEKIEDYLGNTAAVGKSSDHDRLSQLRSFVKVDVDRVSQESHSIRRGSE